MPAHHQPRAEPCAASIGAAPELRRCGVPRQAVPYGYDRYSTAVARGSVVSPGGLLQDKLVESEIGDRTTKPRILLLKVFHPTRLIGLQTAILLAPTVIGLLADRQPPARIRCRPALRQHNLGLTQLADNLLRRVFLEWHSSFPFVSKIT